jgi:murein L,D-transpeptidase YcbB/YkuD
VKTPFRRGLCAALLLSAVPAAASAADNPAYPAIATGMAIPAEARAAVGGQIPMRGRYVLVDAASARLFMIEDGAVRDSMRVIVGKPSAATPALKSVLNYATLNPYWNVPIDLAQKLIAPRVLKDGTTYLTERGYEVVSAFGDNAEILAPDSVDWQAVASGEAQVFVRQRPGPANSMGQIKFGLAQGNGIYLHDTPNKDLFSGADRSLSNGCVRLEDASRFARWLLGNDPALASAAPEQHVALPGSVPITITYLNPQAQMQLASLQ